MYPLNENIFNRRETGFEPFVLVSRAGLLRDCFD